MKVCYKCRTPYLSEGTPGFQDICETCGSYVHCCCNCKFYDELARPSCKEPNADLVSDPNGMNRCEYFVFRTSRGNVDAFDDPETRRMRRRPDWRNVRGNGAPPKGGYATPDAEERARRARENLERLFGEG